MMRNDFGASAPPAGTNPDKHNAERLKGPDEQPVPKISVIIPAYNSATFVGTAIESALGQTYPPIEVIVVDDGSRDDTAQVAARYPAPVRVIKQINGGPGAARNRGAREAKGDWLGLLDADDSWLPNKLERQIKYITRPNIGVIHSFCDTDAGRTDVPAEVKFDDLWVHNYVSNSSALVRRAAFEMVNGFDEDRSLMSVEDYNLWLRISAAGWDIVTCPEPLWRYTPADNSLTCNLFQNAEAEFANITKIAGLLNLAPDKIKRKQVELSVEFGRGLLYVRDLRHARPLLATACRYQPSVGNLARYLMTFIPSGLLRRRSAR